MYVSCVIKRTNLGQNKVKIFSYQKSTDDFKESIPEIWKSPEMAVLGDF